MARTTSRCREHIEGRVGRRHTYRCRICGIRFQVFLSPGVYLELKERVCSRCKVEAEVNE